MGAFYRVHPDSKSDKLAEVNVVPPPTHGGGEPTPAPAVPDGMAALAKLVKELTTELQSLRQAQHALSN